MESNTQGNLITNALRLAQSIALQYRMFGRMCFWELIFLFFPFSLPRRPKWNRPFRNVTLLRPLLGYPGANISLWVSQTSLYYILWLHLPKLWLHRSLSSLLPQTDWLCITRSAPTMEVILNNSFTSFVSIDKIVLTCVSQDSCEINLCNTTDTAWEFVLNWLQGHRISSSSDFCNIVPCEHGIHSQMAFRDSHLKIPISDAYYTHTHTHPIVIIIVHITVIITWTFGHMAFQIQRVACLHCPFLLLWLGLCNN